MNFLKHVILLNVLVITTIQAQTPELINDFNPGDKDAFSEFNFSGTFIDDKMVFPIVSESVGEELGVLSEGQVSLLKDINAGENDSRPQSFVLFNNEIYFAAIDENGGGIWKTDGTEENTSVVHAFDSNQLPRGLIVSASGYIYYSYANALYRTDGTTNETILEEVNFKTAEEQNDNNYCSYNDEIAFIAEDNDILKLYTIESGTAVLLGQTEESSGFADVFGLNQVEGGLVFGVDDPFEQEVNGTYAYDESDLSVNKITINGSDASRLHNYNDDKALVLVRGKGYYTIDNAQGGTNVLVASSNNIFTQGRPVSRAVNGDNMIFNITDGNSDEYIYYTDGSAGGATQLMEVSEYLSNFYEQDGFAYLASGTSNGFSPELYKINLSQGTYDNFYTFSAPSLDSKSILIMGVMGSKLYFLSNLDSEVGREMYAIDLDFGSSVSETDFKDSPIRFLDDSFQITANAFNQASVSIYSIDGKLVEKNNMVANEVYSLAHLQGMYFLAFEIDGEMFVEKWVR